MAGMIAAEMGTQSVDVRVVWWVLKRVIDTAAWLDLLRDLTRVAKSVQ